MTPDRNPWLESLIRPNLRPYSERAPLTLESVAGVGRNSEAYCAGISAERAARTKRD